jgi:hypothetical protein
MSTLCKSREKNVTMELGMSLQLRSAALSALGIVTELTGDSGIG